MKKLPQPPANANERVLAQEYREEQTGLATTAVTLAHEPLRMVSGGGLEMLYKNGTLLGSADYTISGSAVTLATALIASDVFVARYPYRT